MQILKLRADFWASKKFYMMRSGFWQYQKAFFLLCRGLKPSRFPTCWWWRNWWKYIEAGCCFQMKPNGTLKVFATQFELHFDTWGNEMQQLERLLRVVLSQELISSIRSCHYFNGKLHTQRQTFNAMLLFVGREERLVPPLFHDLLLSDQHQKLFSFLKWVCKGNSGRYQRLTKARW